MEKETKRRVVFLSSPELWQVGHGPQHPLKPERLQRTHELLEEAGALAWSNVRVVTPPLATDDELALFHTRNYIDVVRALSRGEAHLPASRHNFGPGDNPVFEGMYESEARKAGSALQGARLLLDGECEVAFSFSGGLHHGGPDFASGFCVFNDAAVVIQWLRRQGQRVCYIDVDVHHGDGVQDAFYTTDEVLTISLHQTGRTLFPGTGFVGDSGAGRGAGYSVNVPLPPYTTDELYLWAFQQVVPPLVERFQPDVFVSQLGVDTHYKDPLARMALTTRGQEAIFRALDGLAPRWLALGGGGYALDVVPRSWALAFAVMAQRELPAQLPPRYRSRYGGQSFHDRNPPDWTQNEETRVREEVQAVVAAVSERFGLRR